MKSIILFLSILVVSVSANAKGFSFDYANAFKSKEKVEREFREQFAKINKAILNKYGLEVQITSVTKDFSVHTIRGTLIGVGCTLRAKLYTEVSTSEFNYPVGVELATLTGIGIVAPLSYANPDEIDGGWDRQSLLLPLCN
jgi:hypothetical protein